jgi:hypothetical protein
MSTELRDALDQLVDRCEAGRGDWDDVLGRTTSEPGARRRNLSILALALLTLTLALFATPAFGLRDAVLGLIGREDITFEEGAPAPAVVRKQFEDLALGAPPGMDPQAIPSAMRRAGTFEVGGRNRALWLGPTRRGGFCYSLEGSGGGCLGNEPLPPGRIGLSYQASSAPGDPVEAGPLQGWVLNPDAARIAITFEDKTTVDVPFTYVSAPIDAGFFVYDVPSANRREPHRPRVVTVFDAAGKELARETIRYGRIAPSDSRRIPPQKLPAKPPVPPSAPLQRATVNGVTVVAGANGAVAFDSTGAEDATARLLDTPRASYVCFKFRTGSARGYGVSGGYQPKVGVRYFGVGTPFDGCEIQGSYGHRWPDRNGSHSAVEIPFTPAAERFFEDRAAARDLALFVRMRKVQQLRKRTGDELVRALGAEFGSAIDRLGSRVQRPDAGRIGYWPGSERSVFRRVSTTGRVFEVEVTAGKVTRDNLGELAMVF